MPSTEQIQALLREALAYTQVGDVEKAVTMLIRAVMLLEQRSADA